MPALASLHHYLCHPSHTNISIKSVPWIWKIGRRTSIMLAIMLGYNKSRITQIFRTNACELKRIITLWLAPYEYEICTTFLLFRALARIILLKDNSIDCSLQNTDSPQAVSLTKPESLRLKAYATETRFWRRTPLLGHRIYPRPKSWFLRMWWIF